MRRYVVCAVAFSLFGLLALPVAAAPRCHHGGAPVIDVRHRVENDADSGTKGNYWAYDAYRKRIRVWDQGDGTFCAEVHYLGTFSTVAGPSPGGSGTVDDGIDGALAGGYTATLTGVLDPHPAQPRHGNLGLFDYQCDAATGDCPGRFDFVKAYFGAGATFDFIDWAWIYFAAGHGIWLNASSGNLGDIVN